MAWRATRRASSRRNFRSPASIFSSSQGRTAHSIPVCCTSQIVDSATPRTSSCDRRSAGSNSASVRAQGNWQAFRGFSNADEARAYQANQAAANQAGLDASGFGNQDAGEPGDIGYGSGEANTMAPAAAPARRKKQQAEHQRRLEREQAQGEMWGYQQVRRMTPTQYCAIPWRGRTRREGRGDQGGSDEGPAPAKTPAAPIRQPAGYSRTRPQETATGSWESETATAPCGNQPRLPHRRHRNQRRDPFPLSSQLRNLNLGRSPSINSRISRDKVSSR